VKLFAAAKSRTLPDEGTQNEAIAAIPNAIEPARFNVAISESRLRRGRAKKPPLATPFPPARVRRVRPCPRLCREVATSLAARIEELGPFELITRGDELPVFAFTVKDEVDNYTVFDVSNAIRERGWLVPAYTFPENRTDLAALRVVVKRGFSHDMADLLVADLKRQLPRLEKQPHPLHEGTATSFHH
jgi:hypothetical protein